MPFTDRELVKKHLIDFRVGQVEVKGFQAVFSGTDPLQLPHSGLDESSVVVKANESSAPQLETKTLTNDWVSLAHTDIVSGSVVVANDTSLGAVYIENVDFTVDYDGGQLRRIDSGSIPSGQTIAIWYFYYRRYTVGSDYTMDAANGRIGRLNYGTIEDGQAVLIDYAAGFGALTDETIDQAIAEADQAIVQAIDSMYHDSVDPGLVVAETQWAVSILCRVRATAELSGPSQKTTAAASAAKAWMELAAQYHQSAARLLKRFCRSAPAMRYPAFVPRG